MTHRRRATPLHAARAGIAALWCLALAAVALSFEHPVLLAALLAIVLAAARPRGSAARLRALLCGRCRSRS